MISVLNTNKQWTPEQTLIDCQNKTDGMESCVVAYFKKGTGGEAFLVHSAIDNRDLLFLSKAIEHYVMSDA